MKNILSVLIAFLFLVTISSCGGEETCETCSSATIITQDGVEASNQELDAEKEYCGDALDAFKEKATSTTIEVNGIEQITSVVVTCN